MFGLLMRVLYGPSPRCSARRERRRERKAARCAAKHARHHGRPGTCCRNAHCSSVTRLPPAAGTACPECGAPGCVPSPGAVTGAQAWATPMHGASVYTQGYNDAPGYPSKPAAVPGPVAWGTPVQSPSVVCKSV